MIDIYVGGLISPVLKDTPILKAPSPSYTSHISNVWVCSQIEHLVYKKKMLNGDDSSLSVCRSEFGVNTLGSQILRNVTHFWHLRCLDAST